MNTVSTTNAALMTHRRSPVLAINLMLYTCVRSDLVVLITDAQLAKVSVCKR